MDFQNRAGNKAGGGGNLSFSERNVDRRERLRLLAMEVTDLNKDPYIIRNSYGTYECKLCKTIHNNEGDYLAHTQAKKHKTNLAKRKLKTVGADPQVLPKEKEKELLKIGKPGYKLSKILNPETNEISLLIEIEFSELNNETVPKYKIIKSTDQSVEPKDEKYQYIVFAADPYENIAFKVPNKEVDYSEEKYFCNWDGDNKNFNLLLTFKK
jgi:splicing factor 3A subunit 2